MIIYLGYKMSIYILQLSVGRTLRVHCALRNKRENLPSIFVKVYVLKTNTIAIRIYY